MSLSNELDDIELPSVWSIAVPLDGIDVGEAMQAVAHKMQERQQEHKERGFKERVVTQSHSISHIPGKGSYLTVLVTTCSEPTAELIGKMALKRVEEESDQHPLITERITENGIEPVLHPSNGVHSHP